MADAIDTAAKRAKLTARKNPYWRGVSGGRGGLSLGYRTAAKSAGSWVAKIVIGGSRLEERIGLADDGRANGTALSYAAAVAAALAWGKQQATIFEASRDASSAAAVPTVRSAILAYSAIRQERAKRAGSELQLKMRTLNYGALSDMRLSKLTAKAIEEWRAQLPSTLAASSRNRLVADLRAALNAAADKFRRDLPGYISGEIKAGTRPEDVAGEARRQLLTDAQVRAVADAAFEVDVDGDFGRLVLLAATTGARFSQLAALTVADVQISNLRIMLPGSRKGRKRKARPHTPIPLTPHVIEHLRPIVLNRRGDAPLLLRWYYRRTKGPIRWRKEDRRPWGRAYEVEKLWGETVKLSGLPQDTIMYALRHSSIVRGLSLGLPVRMVAALHDTSLKMIEKHYSAFIIDITEDLARRTALSFDAPQPLLLEAAE